MATVCVARSAGVTALSEGEKIDSDAVSRLFSDHADELVRFLTGVAGDIQLARDAVQISFTKLIEQGGPDKRESRKAWLFRVAYNEVLATRRRQVVGDRVKRGLQWLQSASSAPADDLLVRRESVESVRAAIDQLPTPQSEIVRLRIYEEMTFAEIASQLQIPLGTALSRMRAAMGSLRKRLEGESPLGRETGDYDD